jgi:3'(2'), 5'-bisphosphate nucleotidase
MIKPNLNDMHNITSIAKKAGETIMQIYQKDLSVAYKEDQSPLTEADLASHRLICDELNKLYPDIPILSEESADNFTLANENACFWCVDPLDGTKEFIKKNDEFTVNIALIQNQQPILGVIGVPVQNMIFAAVKALGAFKQMGGNELQKIRVKPQHLDNLTFAVSRSHLDERTKAMVDEYKAEIMQAGSALKIVYLAEGLVDVYPRFGPTSLWDMAAGHVILRETGGEIFSFDYKPLVYNVAKLLNPDLIAVRNKNLKFRMEGKHES